jgi:hypothetical protein
LKTDLAEAQAILQANEIASLVLAAIRHFEPVQFLFYLVQRIVADLVVSAHGKNGLSGRPKGSTMNLTVLVASGVGSFRLSRIANCH